MYRIVIIIAKLVSIISKTLGFGAGATWPGEIALRLHPLILSEFSRQNKKIILVAGTNGKTTTTKGKSFGAWFSSLFDTHPPIDERIKLLRSM